MVPDEGGAAPPATPSAPTAPSASQKQAKGRAVARFLLWAYALSPMMGLQSYRLITELIHKKLCAMLTSTFKLDLSDIQKDSSYALGNQVDR